MKPELLSGTRDFGPEIVARRNYLFNILKNIFEKYGYQPIETPAMEKLSTLTGKYGEEGDQLLFKILNNGDFLKDADQQDLEDRASAKLIPSISKRGLRYDLTVPFARFVVMNQNDLTFPFKRYQIQPVWRADRPQANRYQEFFQCDVDVVGSDSLVYEAELVQIYDEAFTQLGLEVEIRINNRKILAGIAEAAGITDRFTEMTIAIDKLDKIGKDGVRKELLKRGIDESSVETIEKILDVKNLEELRPFLGDTPSGKAGMEELQHFYKYYELYTGQNPVVFDITLARGLNYYTGCIFEVKALGIDMGSIGGGGRYADLTSVFGLKDMPGVGVSFGADRIYNALEAKGLFPDEAQKKLQLLFIAFDEPTHVFAYKALTKVRAAGIRADIYPDPVKLKRQMKYANNIGVPYVVLVGSEEMNTGKFSLKNMVSGEQEKLDINAILQRLQ